MDIPFNELFNSTSFKEYWMEPIVVVFGVTLLGFIFKNVIHNRLKKAAEYSKWKTDDIIIAAVESQIIFWFFLFGLSVALKDLPITDQYLIYLRL